MKKTCLLTTAALLVSTSAFADGHALPQADNEWFAAGQAMLAEKQAVELNTNKAKNVIILISDGNGVGTNYASRIWAGQQEGGFGDDYTQPHEAFPHLSLVKTYNTNAQTPDSAGTGTAMMSGIKTKAGVVGVTADVNRGDCATIEGNTVLSMNDIMSSMGKETGIVSTARITHATPASAYAKSVDRNFEASVPEGCDTQKDIASQLLDAMKAGTIDVAMGGGKRNFHAGEGGRREDGADLIEMAKGEGVQFAEDQASFDALTLDGTPILGLFENSHMKYEADRDDEPSLAEMTEAAIKMLQAKSGDNGFFLQVEAGRVDHALHGGNMARVVQDQKAMADAVAMADALTDDADTLIIVTADHEHAVAFNGYCGRGSNILGLCMGINGSGTEHTGEPELADDGKPYTVVGFLNGAGTVLREDQGYTGGRPDLDEATATDLDYTQQALIPKSSETHSGEDVAAYAKGPFAHLINGTIEQNFIFHVMHHAATAE